MTIKSILEYCIDKFGTRQEYSEITDCGKAQKKNDFILKKYQTIYETSPDLYRTINIDGIILECNNAYAQSLGYAKEEIIGKSIFDHVPNTQLHQMREINQIWKENHVVNNKEIWLKRKDGTSFPALISAFTIYDEYGNAQSSTIIKDMTETYIARKKIEENAKFDRMKLDELKKADLLKDEFMAMITHELKTPLFPILGYCEMLSKHISSDNLTAEQVEMIDEIQKNSTKLAYLIGDLLDVQKLEMGKLQFKKTAFNIDEFLKDLYNTFSNLVSKNSIKFSVENNNDAFIFSDKERLTQVFRNIIVNAIDFVQKPGGKIGIGTNIVDDDVIFYVKDNGIGIPKNKQALLFQKFYQTDTSLGRKHGGNGLGLAICKGIVERLGGKIWVESEEKKGSTFYFSVPKNEKRQS